MLKEWPLVAFTIAGQTAVGFLLAAGLPLFFLRGGAAGAPARGPRLAVVVAALGLMAAAAFVSFFHLQHPFRAVRALANLRTSRLSREILFELGLMALLAGLAFLLWARTGEEGLLRALFAAAGVSGVLFVWSMSNVYMLRSVPAWDHGHTPVSFFLTAALLGSLTAAVFSGFRSGGGPPSKAFLAAVLVLVAAAFLWALLTAPAHGTFGARPPASLVPPGGASSALHAARLIMLVLGSLALAAALWREGPAPALGAKAGLAAPVGLAWVLVLVGEVLGRFHFYGQVGRPGP